MVSQKEGLTLVEGLCVYDCIVVMQMIDKLLKGGLVTGKEVGHVATLRAKAISVVERAIGLNLDNGLKDQEE